MDRHRPPSLIGQALGFALALVLLAPGFVAATASQPATTAAQPPAPRVLLVTAHPDDDALFAGAVYKITHALAGTVDLAVVTNGEGGYRYSTLAEPIYGLDLTDEEVGRAYLPGIRKRELMAGGAIVGIRNYFFLDQVDGGFTLDLDEAVAGGGWDLELLAERFDEILRRERYDFVFVMLPTAETHAHHRASALLALTAVAALDEQQRPIVLGTTTRGERRPAPAFTGLADQPLSRIRPGAPVFTFDRRQKFGLNDRLDYNIIVNWVIAEHKSQGTMQLLMNAGDAELYFYFDLNPEAGLAPTRELFERLATGPPHRSGR